MAGHERQVIGPGFRAVQRENRRTAPAPTVRPLVVGFDATRGGLLALEISEKLLCLFSADVTDDGDRYVVEVPRREIRTGSIDPGETYRVALISAEESESIEESEDGSVAPGEPQPPVEPGEMRYVEIEDIGKQGDGIARVERGYVIIVPGADIGERVKVEVTEVKSNFAVGEIIEE